tara:strand:+ start:476 stop:1072 length:597 start_codon:yes stop_codon:yes gene_type:complete
MKLLLENWRKFINEVEMQDATMLSIFDFDETIAFTTSYADAFDKNTGEFVKRIYSQKEQEAAKDSGLYDLDFSSYDEVEAPMEVKSVTSKLRKRIADPRVQVMVLTARASRSEDDIHRYLQSLEPPIDTTELLIKGLAGANKGEFTLDVLDRYRNFTSVEFLDDSDKNLSDMKAASEKRPDVDFEIYKAHEGSINPVE